MAAAGKGVWGIDIGQAGLKALRLRYAEAADQVLAVAFDYVPHPKILSQPDAIPEELIPQALETFLSRNQIEGDDVCISVPGQTALARFIQLPPVEKGKVPEIVKFEAKQQIPFDLDEVIWDYQLLGAGSEESGFLLDSEVGLFAMKRDQVMKSLKPFTDRKVEVELIQIAPLALYNFLTYDRLGLRPDSDAPDAEDYTIVLDMGADNTMLLVSNGVKIWIRNVPIGGNHFTRALTKEMKLTFAKAEHLKCNATRSEDPRAVFQALRPVFNDYVAEIQRSIGYFSSVNRDAKVAKILGLGNGFKLAGLQKFLQQNLQYPVERVDGFDALVGDAVLGAPLFEENLLSFAVPYGLALQGLERTRVSTTLLPPEIATARKIRRKKPWAVATAAALLVGLALSASATAYVYKSVSTDRFGGAEEAVGDLKTKVGTDEAAYQKEESEYNDIKEDGEKLIGDLDAREDWPALFKAINVCLPVDTDDALDETDIRKHNRLKIYNVTAKKMSDVGEWFEGLPADAVRHLPTQDQETPPSGEGYVFTLKGVHYHKVDHADDPYGRGILWVKHYFLKNLQKWSVAQRQGDPKFPVRGLGITHATIDSSDFQKEIEYDPNEKNRRRGLGGRGFGGGGFGGRGGGLTGFSGPGSRPGVGPLAEEPQREIIRVPQVAFSIQFVWQPIPPKKRRTFMAIDDFLASNKDAGFPETQEQLKAKGLELSQEEFDEFKSLDVQPEQAEAAETPE